MYIYILCGKQEQIISSQGFSGTLGTSGTTSANALSLLPYILFPFLFLFFWGLEKREQKKRSRSLKMS